MPRPIAPDGVLVLILTCSVWLLCVLGVLALTDVLCVAPFVPCVLAECKLAASYTMKPPHRPDGVLAFTDVPPLFGSLEEVSLFEVAL